MNNKIFEWTGVTTAILYSLFVALNIGIEFIGLSLLLLSAALIGIWAYREKHKGILLLQFFYASAGVIGMISIGDVLKIMIKEQKELIDHLQKFITS